MALRRRLHAQGGADDGQGGGGGDAQGGGGDEAHGAAFWEREAVWEGDGDVDTAGGSAGAPGGVAVVLTGATGFLGPHLLAALAAHPTLSSATIYCLVRPPVSRDVIDALDLDVERAGQTVRNFPPATVFRFTRRDA